MKKKWNQMLAILALPFAMAAHAEEAVEYDSLVQKAGADELLVVQVQDGTLLVWIDPRQNGAQKIASVGYIYGEAGHSLVETAYLSGKKIVARNQWTGRELHQGPSRGLASPGMTELQKIVVSRF